MNRKLCLLLLSPIILTSAGCNTNGESGAKKVDVIIISGQSNAVGCTYSEYIEDTYKYGEYQKGYSNIQIAYDCWTKDWPASGITFYSQNTSKNNDFVKVKLGQGNSINTFGPEIGIAEAMHEKYGDKLFLIKFACGGSNLKDDWLGSSSPMYGRMIDYVKLQMENLKKKGYAPTIKAFCWMQGEGDSYYGYYQSYRDNLRTFINDVRDDLRSLAGDKDIPFIDAGISDASEWEYYRQVNNAKKLVADENDNNFYIDTIAAGLHTDKEPLFKVDVCHYDSESEIQLGHLFAEYFEPFLDK